MIDTNYSYLDFFLQNIFLISMTACIANSMQIEYYFQIPTYIKNDCISLVEARSEEILFYDSQLFQLQLFLLTFKSLTMNAADVNYAFCIKKLTSFIATSTVPLILSASGEARALLHLTF